MTIIKSLKEFGLSIKGVSETMKTKQKEQRCWFFNMLLGTSGDSFLGNLLPGEGTIRAGKGAIATIWERGTIRSGEGTIRTGQDF